MISEQALRSHDLMPLARVHAMMVTAGDPDIMLEEPIPATQRALQRAGMKIEDIDLYEVTEVFTPVALTWLQAIGGSCAAERQWRRDRARSSARRIGHDS